MAYFFARVELHDTEYDDDVYTILHEELAERGFKREFFSINKKLPRATYLMKAPEGMPTTGAVRLIKQAVFETNKTASIIAVKFESKEDIQASELENISE